MSTVFKPAAALVAQSLAVPCEPHKGNGRHAAFHAAKAGSAGNPDPGTYPLTIFYESACALCDAEMTNLRLRNSGDLLVFVDVSAPGFTDLPQGTTMQDLLTLIHARAADGRLIKGVPVFELAYKAVGLDWISMAMRLPLVASLATCGYPILARNRHRIPRRLVGWIFEGATRRAAERAAAARCTAESCTR
jgi:predicted DCC family thiol-disulfide oxidoreductase YuxK